jgi:hypothetical protein
MVSAVTPCGVVARWRPSHQFSRRFRHFQSKNGETSVILIDVATMLLYRGRERIVQNGITLIPVEEFLPTL